jgi:Methyltransferase FkbM domain
VPTSEWITLITPLGREFDDLIRVRGLSLDQAYENPNVPKPDLVKLDIEGAELLALPHAEKLTSEVRPLIILELHNPECDAAAWEFAGRANYTLESLDTGQLRTKQSGRRRHVALPSASMSQLWS